MGGGKTRTRRSGGERIIVALRLVMCGFFLFIKNKALVTRHEGTRRNFHTPTDNGSDSGIRTKGWH